MKLSIGTIASTAVFAQCASAHYIWTTIVTSDGTESTAAIRQPQNNSPVTNVSSTDITCNVSPSPATATVPVTAGTNITFLLDNTIYHEGPAAVYLGKAPTTAAAWDGSGASWFKIAEWGAVFDPFNFIDFGASQLTATVPASVTDGEYLARIEQIGLHIPDAPQFYISCAQISITGGGSAAPSMVSIPGYVSADDPSLTVNIYYPIPTAYTVPGPPVFTG